jgi:hypothetical protein
MTYTYMNGIKGDLKTFTVKAMKYSQATSSINLKITLLDSVSLSTRSAILVKHCLPNRFSMLDRERDSRMLDICTELKLVPRRFYHFYPADGGSKIL